MCDWIMSYNSKFINNTPASPIKLIIVSMTVQVERVSFTERLKYSLTIQNAPSLTCESIRLPDPIARTNNSLLTVPFNVKGRRIPAVVKPATVAEPTHIRKIAAIIHPNNRGDIFDLLSKTAI